MTNDEYILQLAQALTRQEDLTAKEAQDVLFELALRVYALLLAQVPGTGLERTLRWRELRGEVMLWLVEAVQQIGQQLFSRIAAGEQIVTTATAERYGLAPAALGPRPIAEVLDATEVMGTSVSTMFIIGPTGTQIVAEQLMRLLERSLNAGFFAGDTTPELAARIIAPRTRAGIVTGEARRGTIANAWRERIRAITAAALWALITPTQQRAASIEGALPVSRWRWSAILDPRTCPICRPLDGVVAATPAAFPLGPPPLHPLCRCIILPTSS